MNMIYTAKRSNEGWEATMLEDGASTAKPVEYPGFESLEEVKQVMSSRYPAGTLVGPNKFDAELASRQVHSEEMLKRLKKWSSDNDLTTHVVYGSISRPMSRIAFGSMLGGQPVVYIHGCNGYTATKEKPYTYVVSPVDLEKEVLEHYDLVFISRPA